MEVSAELFGEKVRFPPHCPFSEKKLNYFIKMATGFL